MSIIQQLTIYQSIAGLSKCSQCGDVEDAGWKDFQDCDKCDAVVCRSCSDFCEMCSRTLCKHGNCPRIEWRVGVTPFKLPWGDTCYSRCEDCSFNPPSREQDKANHIKTMQAAALFITGMAPSMRAAEKLVKGKAVKKIAKKTVAKKMAPKKAAQPKSQKKKAATPKAERKAGKSKTTGV